MINRKNLVDLPVPELSKRLLEQLNSEIEKNYEPFIVKIDKNIAIAELEIKKLKVSAFDLIMESPEAAVEVRQEIERVQSFINSQREKQSSTRKKITAIKNLADKVNATK